MLLTLERATVKYMYFVNNSEACKAMWINIFCRYSSKRYIQINGLEGPQILVDLVSGVFQTILLLF